MTSDPFNASLTADGRYRLLVESISDYAIYMLDSDGVVVNWNAGAERFKGYKADEIVGQNFARFYTPEDRAKALPEENLATARRAGRLEQEGWRLRKDGTRFWAHVVIDRIVDPAGNLIGFAKISRDLTERKAAEAELRRSEEQFRLLVQGVTDYALYMLDPSGNIASWNAGAERIKQFSADEIIGQHFSRFHSPEDQRRGMPAQSLRVALEEGRFEREGWRFRKDGTRFWAHVVIDPVYDDQKKLVGFAKITRDVTERKLAQEKLDQTREALFQAQKVEAIGQLTGGVAHDFNNLLMAILGSLEIVSKRLPPDPRITPFLENAVQGAQRGASLTQRMLAFARKQELRMDAVDIPSVVSGLGGLLERTLGPAFFITTRIPLSLPLVHTDKAQLESALLNLAVNARDAMPNGGSIVVAAAHRSIGADEVATVPAGNYVLLSVSDKGEGMHRDVLARATEPFFTTKGVGRGTGLGLSMVQGLAEQSGGKLVLSSQPGQGTTAELWLPLAADGPDQATPVAPSYAPARKRILTVDDDSLVLMNTVAMLEDLGHEVFDATSAAEALAIIEKQEVDLVITDHAMPHMTGADLANRLAETHPNLPIIVATGYAELPAGFSKRHIVLGKPFSSGDLSAAVGQALAEPAGL